MREATALLNALGRGSPMAERELRVEADELVEVMTELKSLGDFLLLDIDATDSPEGFEVAYRLLDRGGEGGVGLFTVRVRADRTNPSLPSLVAIWKSADVMEREVWDLMGVRFEGREGLKRILCADDFEGHPLRKDFRVERTPRFDDTATGGTR